MAKQQSAILDVLDYIPEMICIVRVKRQGNTVSSSIIRCNKDAASFVGYDERYIVNKGNRFMDAILHPNDREQYRQTIHNIVLQSNSEHAVLFRIKPRGANDFITLTGCCSVLENSIELNNCNLVLTLYKQIHNDVKPSLILNSRNKRIVANTLTQREKEIAHYLIQGYTDKEIAKLLDISVCTAKNHRSNIKNKLEKRNATELVSFLVSAGVGEGVGVLI